MIEERSSGIVVFRIQDGDRYFLLLNYPSGHWDFVKGKIEPGETDHQTAIREAKEETGIDELKFIDNFEQEIEYSFQFEKKMIHKQVVFFLAETKTKEIVISFEHQDFAWLEFDEAIKKITFDNAKKVLKKANAVLNQSI